MKSLYQFIVKPKNERYDNIRKFNDKELIINTNIGINIIPAPFGIIAS